METGQHHADHAVGQVVGKILKAGSLTDPSHFLGGGAAVDEVGDGDVRDAGVGGKADLASTAVGVADRDAFDLGF